MKNFKRMLGRLRLSHVMVAKVVAINIVLNSGIFTKSEYSRACRLQASLVLLRFGHARGKTTLSCFLTLSRRFATRSARSMRTPLC